MSSSTHMSYMTGLWQGLVNLNIVIQGSEYKIQIRRRSALDVYDLSLS